MVQVIGEWVESKTLDEVLAAMKEARVPSGGVIPYFVGNNSLLQMPRLQDA